MKPSDIAHLLRHLRTHNGRTIAEAASASNNGRWQVYRWEHGEGLSPVADVWSYIESLGYTVTVRRDRAVANLLHTPLRDKSE